MNTTLPPVFSLYPFGGSDICVSFSYSCPKESQVGAEIIRLNLTMEEKEDLARFKGNLREGGRERGRGRGRGREMLERSLRGRPGKRRVRGRPGERVSWKQGNS